jgi:hypothetical protein
MGRNTGNNNRAPGYVMNKDRYLLRSNHAKGNIHKNLPAVVSCLFMFMFFFFVFLFYYCFCFVFSYFFSIGNESSQAENKKTSSFRLLPS